MYLKSLEISGFKSFAKKISLDFNAPITAIVGPNGSGKSNVAEAFRFVLGEQSIKSMRGKRGEDLIFNGGKSLGRQNRASVKVTFDNKQRMFDMDFDEVSIERVVHRDSVNEYFLNGSAVRLKDIIELLSGAHIGSSGHHIISQGEADKILNANLKERREMIEDALGLKIYHYKRQESERKLEKTEENIKQVQSLRREIAPHLKFLEGQVKKVEKAREMRSELENLYSIYFKRESIYIKSEKARIEKEKIEPTRTKASLEKELSEAKAVLERSQTKDQKSERLLSIESELQKIRAERDSLAREIGRVEGQIASEERIIRRQRELAESNEMKSVQLRDVEAVAQSVYQKIDEAEKEPENRTLLQSIFRNIRSLLSDFISHNKNQAEKTLTSESEAEIEKLVAEKKVLSEKADEADKSEKNLKEEYYVLRTDIEKEKDSNRDAEKSVFRIMALHNEVMAQLQSVKNEEEKISIVDANFKRELQEAAALVGRSVFDFDKAVVVLQSGAEISLEEIAAAPRVDQEDRRKAIERIKIRLEESGGAGGEEVLKEFTEARERDAFLEREIADLGTSAETLRVLIKDLETTLDTEFKNGIIKINTQFQNFFVLMFGGGTANLDVVRDVRKNRPPRLEDSALLLGKGGDEDEGFSEEESEEGIDINVSLPQKKIKGLMMLSGGERALTSIALLFAVSQVNPPPFIILDETDAALDEANSRKYGDMIDNLSKYSELILITHNRETMSRAGVLYGVTMGSEGFSKLLSIKFEEAVEVAK